MQSIAIVQNRFGQCGGNNNEMTGMLPIVEIERPAN
jgi:hypothetical protein